MRTLLTLLTLQACLGWFGGASLYGQIVDSAEEASRPEERVEEGIVRIDVGGVVTRDVIVLFAGDSLYLPLLESAVLFGFDVGRTDAGATTISVDGTRLLEHDSLSVRTPSDRRSNATAPGLRRWFGGVLYLEWQSLFEILDIPAVYDPEQLFIRLAPSTNIPVVSWARERNLATIGRLTARDDPAAGDARYFRSMLGAPELHWKLGHHAFIGERGVAGSSISGDIHLSAPLLMGQLDVGIAGRSDKRVDGGLRWDLTDWRWTYNDPSGSLLTYARAGRIVAADRSAIGITLSNRPLTPRRLHAHFSHGGSTEPGSVVRMVRGGTTTAQATADSTGHFRFDIPIGYGTTSARFLYRSADGEIIEQALTWSSAAGIVPAGRIDYDVSAGMLRTGSDVLVGDLSLRVGMTSRWTAHLLLSGLHSLADSATLPTRASHARVGVTGWVGRSTAIIGRIDLATGALSGRLDLGGSTGPGLSLVADSIHLDGRSDVTASARLPIGSIRFDAGVRLQRQLEKAWDVATFGSLRAGLGNSGISLSAAIPHLTRSEDRLSHDLLVGFGAYTFPVPWLHITSGLRWHSGAADASELSIGATAHLRGGRRIGVGAIFPLSDVRDPDIGVRVEFPIGRIRPILSATAGSAYSSLTTTIDGATIIAPSGVAMLPIGVRGQCSIVLTGFDDRNGNGMRDDGERRLGSIDADISYEGVTSRVVGGRVEGLPPHRFVRIDVDRYGHVDEGLIPSKPSVRLTTAPSSVVHIDIPYTKGRDVTGTVSVLVDSVPDRNASSLLSALDASLVTEEGVVFEGEVFSDGTIYFSGIPNGAYSLRFDQRQLDARGLAVSGRPDPIIVDDETRSDPEITLMRSGI